MFILLFLFWLILNGRITFETVVLGLVFSGLIYVFLCRFMGYSVKRDIKVSKLLFYVIEYLLVLVWEILKANVSVISVILSARYVNEPKIVHFRTSLKSEAARVALANSITLTPGTITVSLEGDTYTVHCLDKEFASGIEHSVFVRMLERMERLMGEYDVSGSPGKESGAGKSRKKGEKKLR